MPSGSMQPLEALGAVRRFAARHGRDAVELAMHAAVPTGLRPELLPLIRANFLKRRGDATLDSDLLMSELCREVGAGYFEIDPEARQILLGHLQSDYPEERGTRLPRVARFLLRWTERQEARTAGTRDQLWKDYLQIQRWVALAFSDPSEAARQLAKQLSAAQSEETPAARLRLGGLASALALPLDHHPRLLRYASGVEALETGMADRARRLLEPLGSQPVEVEGVKLRAPTELLPQAAEKAREEPAQASSTGRIRKAFVSTNRDGRRYIKRVNRALAACGVSAGPRELKPGVRWKRQLERDIEDADAFFAIYSGADSSNGAGNEWRRAEREQLPIFAFFEVGSPVPSYASSVTVVSFSSADELEDKVAKTVRRIAGGLAAIPPIARDYLRPKAFAPAFQSLLRDRRVVIVGPGGSGKTNFAAALAHEADRRGLNPRGCAWIQATGIGSLDELAAAIETFNPKSEPAMRWQARDDALTVVDGLPPGFDLREVTWLQDSRLLIVTTRSAEVAKELGGDAYVLDGADVDEVAHGLEDLSRAAKLFPDLMPDGAERLLPWLSQEHAIDLAGALIRGGVDIGRIEKRLQRLKPGNDRGTLTALADLALSQLKPEDRDWLCWLVMFREERISARRIQTLWNQIEPTLLQPDMRYLLSLGRTWGLLKDSRIDEGGLNATAVRIYAPVRRAMLTRGARSGIPSIYGRIVRLAGRQRVDWLVLDLLAALIEQGRRAEFLMLAEQIPEGDARLQVIRRLKAKLPASEMLDTVTRVLSRKKSKKARKKKAGRKKATKKKARRKKAGKKEATKKKAGRKKARRKKAK